MNMERSKSHGLKENDQMTYKKYLDDTNGEQSPDTAPTLIPKIDGENIELKSYYELLDRTARVLEKARDFTSAIAVMDLEHFKIHQAKGYSASLVHDNLANNGVYNIVIIPDKPIHFQSYKLWFDDAQATVRLYEGVESYSGGTQVNVKNRNRINKIPNGADLFKGVSVTLGDAELLEEIRVGGGGDNPSARTGGQKEKDVEWVMEPGTIYLYQIQNESGSSADLGFWAFWYTTDDDF